MNCLKFRRAFGADPHHASALSREHRAQCPACEEYAQESLRLEGLIKRALEIPVPAAGDAAQSAPQGRWNAYRLAMAASVLLAVGIGALWVLAYPRDSLASDIVAHVESERESMQPGSARVSTELLDATLRAKGLHMAKPMGDISYLQSCQFRGRIVPHIVVQADRGPVTVLLLTEEQVTTVQRFAEHGYRGILMPMQKGSVAILATDASLAESVADRVKMSIAWN